MKLRGSLRPARREPCRADHWLALVCFGLAVIGCGPGGASPIPQPPLGAVPVERVVGVPPSSGGAGREDLPLLRGPAGLLPPEALLLVTDLETSDPPFATRVAADGSFELGLPINVGDELRLEVLVDEQRSVPSDAVVGPDYALESAARLACLEITPALSLQLPRGGGEGALFAVNRCGSTVTLDVPRPRRALPDFAALGDFPLALAPDEQSTLRFSYEPSSPQRENVLFMDVTNEGTTLRYPFTLWSSDL